jgi:hypothetical protein
MARKEIDRIEAGGFEDELRRLIDAVEAEREELLRSTRGRKARAEVVDGIKAEVVGRFGEAHPDVKARFLSGPYRDADVPRGQKGRMR